MLAAMGGTKKSNGYSGTRLQIFISQILDNIASKDKTENGNILCLFG